VEREWVLGVGVTGIAEASERCVDEALDFRIREDHEQRLDARVAARCECAKAARMLVPSAGAVSRWIPAFAGMTSKSEVRAVAARNECAARRRACSCSRQAR